MFRITDIDQDLTIITPSLPFKNQTLHIMQPGIAGDKKNSTILCPFPWAPQDYPRFLLFLTGLQSNRGAPGPAPAGGAASAATGRGRGPDAGGGRGPGSWGGAAVRGRGRARCRRLRWGCGTRAGQGSGAGGRRCRGWRLWCFWSRRWPPEKNLYRALLKYIKRWFSAKRGSVGVMGPCPWQAGCTYRRWAAWVASVSKPLLMKMRGCYITNVKNQK